MNKKSYVQKIEEASKNRAIISNLGPNADYAKAKEAAVAEGRDLSPWQFQDCMKRVYNKDLVNHRKNGINVSLTVRSDPLMEAETLGWLETMLLAAQLAERAGGIEAAKRVLKTLELVQGVKA